MEHPNLFKCNLFKWRVRLSGHHRIKHSVDKRWEKLLEKKEHISAILDEYGSLRGIVTMEDVIETMLGQEIVDEKDEVVDMQEYAKDQWEKAQKEIIKADD